MIIIIIHCIVLVYVYRDQLFLKMPKEPPKFLHSYSSTLIVCVCVLDGEGGVSN